MTRLRKALPLLILCAAFFAGLPLAAQSPDCSFTFVFQADATQTGQSNLSGQTPCVNWRVTFSGVSPISSTITFQTSPDNSTWTSVPNTTCSGSIQPPCMLQGSNPIIGNQGMMYLAAYGAYVRVVTSGTTGGGPFNQGTVRAYGAKGASASGATINGTTAINGLALWFVHKPSALVLPTTTKTGVFSVNAATPAVNRNDAGSFITDGFQAGMQLSASGFTNGANNNSWFITAVSAPSLTLSSESTTGCASCVPAVAAMITETAAAQVVTLNIHRETAATVNPATAEQDENAQIAVGDGAIPLDSYTTDSGIPGQLAIPAGVWTFNDWVYMGNAAGTTTVYYQVLKVSAAGVETSLFDTSAAPTIITATASAQNVIQTATIAAPISLATTDRILIRPVFSTTAASKVIHQVYQGTTHAGYILTSFPLGSSSGTLVPYTGATADVDLGANALKAAKIGVGTADFTRSLFATDGTVGNTLGLFGRTITGVALMGAWPSVGLNAYFNGAFKAIATGFGGVIQLTQDVGDLIFFTGPSVATDTNFTLVERMRLTASGNEQVVGGRIALGTFPTITGCGTISATAGGATAGTFTTNTTGTCTAVIPLPTAPNGWTCYVQDVTKHLAANIMIQSASATNSCTVTGTTASGDVLNFMAIGW